MIRLIVKRACYANMGPEHSGSVPVEFVTFDIEHAALEKMLREESPFTNQYVSATIVGGGAIKESDR